MHTLSFTIPEEFVTKKQPVAEISTLSRFLSPKTDEERLLFSKFTLDMRKEVYKFARFFTKSDMKTIFSCKDPKECLYVVARIISRIRWELSVFHNADKNTQSLCTGEIEDVREGLERVFAKK